MLTRPLPPRCRDAKLGRGICIFAAFSGVNLDRFVQPALGAPAFWYVSRNVVQVHRSSSPHLLDVHHIILLTKHHLPCLV